MMYFKVRCFSIYIHHVYVASNIHVSVISLNAITVIYGILFGGMHTL